MKAALGGLYVLVALLVINIVTVLALSSAGRTSFVVEDVVIVAAVLAIASGIGRRALWSRYTGIVVAVLFALGALSLFQAGVPALIKIAGVVQLVVLVGVVAMLLLRPTADWFRGVC